jgi:protein tyrosine phosphatase
MSSPLGTSLDKIWHGLSATLASQIKTQKKENALQVHINQIGSSHLGKENIQSPVHKKLKVTTDESSNNLRKEFEALKIDSGLIPILPYSAGCCRFPNIACPERTVIWQKEELYLHANYVDYEEQGFCATQYPFSNDFPFWSHCFENGQFIIDLTNEQDSIKNQVLPAYTPSGDDFLVCEKLTIKEIKKEPYLLDSKQLLDQTDCYTYLITNTETNETQQIKRIHYRGWLNGQGASPIHLKELISNLAANVSLENKNIRYPIIHCLAGVGRTGTLIVLLRMYEIFKEKFNVLNKQELEVEIKKELAEAIKSIRFQRHYECVQNIEQYKTILDTLKLFY